MGNAREHPQTTSEPIETVTVKFETKDISQLVVARKKVPHKRKM